MTMGLERFERLVGAYGADPRRWPDGERVAAQTFLADDPEARAILDRAAELDDWLALAPAPAPSEMLDRRVLRAAPRAKTISRFGWASGAGWAAAAAAGVLVGVSLGQQMSQAWEAEAVLEQASAWSDDEAEYFG